MTDCPPDRLALDPLLLRRERVADASLVAAAVGRNLDHLRPWMPWAGPASADEQHQRERLAQVEQEWEAGTAYGFLLLDADESALLGIFGLHRRIGPGALELGYWLDAGACGRGYATRAAGALTAQALQLGEVDRVEIHCDEANVRSRAIPARLGYRLDRVEDREPEAPAETRRHEIWIFPAT